MQALIPILLTLLQQVAPGATTAMIGTAVQLLVALVPIVVQEYKDLLPIVQNVIIALQQSDDITEAQWEALDAMSAQYDAEFRAALAAAKAEDAAAKPSA